MTLQWITDPQFLGAVGLDPSKNAHAKAVLAEWNKAQGFIFSGYPTVADMKDSGWSTRDAQMLGSFVIWWNNSSNQPLANWAQAPLPKETYATGIQQSDLTQQHVTALETWATKTQTGLPSCIESCLIDQIGGANPQNATDAQLQNCINGCSGVPQPAPTCPGDMVWDVAGQTCKCPQGLDWALDPATNKCAPPALQVKCTGGQIFNPTTKQCECPPGQLINSATGQCSVPPPTCPPNWQWDAVKKACVPPGAPITPPPSPPTKAAVTQKNNAGVVLAVLAGVGLLGLIINAAIKVPSPPGMQGNPRRRRSRSLGENPHTRGCKVVSQVGDVNPIEYGGGYLFLCKVDGQSNYVVEYTEGAEGDPYESGYGQTPVTVYRVHLPDDVWGENTWAKVEDIAQSIDADPEELREAGSSSDPRERLFALTSIASHWGWHELDNYPLEMTVSELRKHWYRARRSK